MGNTEINKNDIADIQLCNSNTDDGKMLHLITMKDGNVIKKTTSEMRILGLLKVRGGRSLS